jgi:hypothetical protein
MIAPISLSTDVSAHIRKKKKETTDPTMERMARTVYEKDIIARETSWFVVRCALSANTKRW